MNAGYGLKCNGITHLFWSAPVCENVHPCSFILNYVRLRLLRDAKTFSWNDFPSTYSLYANEYSVASRHRHHHLHQIQSSLWKTEIHGWSQEPFLTGRFILVNSSATLKPPTSQFDLSVLLNRSDLRATRSEVCSGLRPVWATDFSPNAIPSFSLLSHVQ